MNKNDYQYLYLLSSKKEYDQLCAMEMASVFDSPTNKNYHLSNQNIKVDRSPFIKGKINILYMDNDIKRLEQRMINDHLAFDRYKISYVKYDDIPYQKRLALLRTLGFAIIGDYAMKDPSHEFVLTKISGQWIFGELERNPKNHLHRKHKPNNYSNALDTTLAKALINIAIQNDFSKKIIDPCCGSGTVIIEGRTLGVDIQGYEINPLVKQQCNQNLQHFHFEGDVTKTDVLTTTKHFDVAILDLPYGQFSFITKEEQLALLKKTKEISDTCVIVTMDDMSEMIESVGLVISKTCEIKKSNAFSRFVSICRS